MLTLNMSDTDRERKKILKKLLLFKKKLLNHLIDGVEELENACFSQQIFKYYKSFFDFQK